MKKFFVLLLLLPSLLVGCIAEDLGPEIPDTGEIVLDNMEIILPASGEDAFYIHVVSLYAWSAQSSVEWISFENNKGEAGSSYLCMSVSENTEPIKRQGVIYFTTDDYNLSAELLVTQEAGKTKELLLVADKNVIYDNGEDYVTFTLYYGEVVLNSGYTLYDGETPLYGNTFSSTKQGTHAIWAAYGAVISNDVNVSVIQTPPTGPAVPEDKYPEKTNFKRRVLLTQFTGTGCGYCPLMMNALHSALQVYGDNIVIAAAHLYNEKDPAYLFEAQTLDNAMSIFDFPNLVADLDKTTRNTDPFYSNVKRTIDSSFNRVAVKGGIAANSQYSATYEYINVNVLVKANETTEFRVGAWLLEDGIYGKQAVYSDPYSETGSLIQPLEGVDFNTHNNCIRLADSKLTSTDYSGFSLGTIEAGKTASREFVFRLKANGEGSATKWNHNNLRVIVFISTKEGNNWYVNNVITVPKDGSVDFEYTE